MYLWEFSVQMVSPSSKMDGQADATDVHALVLGGAQVHLDALSGLVVAGQVAEAGQVEIGVQRAKLPATVRQRRRRDVDGVVSNGLAATQGFGQESSFCPGLLRAARTSAAKLRPVVRNAALAVIRPQFSTQRNVA